MSREIKFRAWHKEEKKMCQVETINLERGAFLIGAKRGIDQWVDDKTVAMAPDNGRFCDWEDCELMQFTGLKDKNGKEIYEGDIVKYDGFAPKFTAGEIVYYVSGFNIKFDERNMTLLSNNVEVIGNIHENPELLKQEDKKRS